jgi:hypothetical protein
MYVWFDSTIAMKAGVIHGLRERGVVDFGKCDGSPLLGDTTLTKSPSTPRLCVSLCVAAAAVSADTD